MLLIYVCVCVCVCVMYQDMIMPGIGEPKVKMYHSLVQYHCPNPYFSETIKLSIPLKLMGVARVRFSMYHKPTTICTSLLVGGAKIAYALCL